MPAVEARVGTGRADRYLRQLCGHADRMSHPGHRPPPGAGIRRAEYSDTNGPDTHGSDATGLIEFEDGRCRLRAEPDALLLRVEADDEDALARITEGVAARLEGIARRDGLAVTWRSVPSSPRSG
jgi:hypothetical protein